MAKLVQYNCKLDEDKKKLAKEMGLNLNEIFRNALDVALKKETKQTSELLNEKELVEIELKELEEAKEKYLNDYNNNKQQLQNKLKQIEISLEDINIASEAESEKDDYNKLVNMVYHGTRITNIEDLIKDHATKYNYDVAELRRQIQNDVAKRKFMI